MRVVPEQAAVVRRTSQEVRELKSGGSIWSTHCASRTSQEVRELKSPGSPRRNRRPGCRTSQEVRELKFGTIAG